VGQESEAISFPEQSSLDSITRQLPSGFYSTFRTFHAGTQVLGLQAHLDRLYLPAVKLGIRPSTPSANLRRQIAALIQAFTPHEARVRIILLREGTPGQVYVALEPLKLLPLSVYEQGVRVVTTQVQRATPTLKTTAFIAASQHEREVLAAQNAFEGFMLHEGHITEGLTSNFFYVRGGKLGTAQHGILKGVTRHEVLEVAHAGGIEILYHALEITELAKIDEAFLTSSSRGIVPIVEADGNRIGAGEVGLITKRLMQLYKADVEKRVETI
jgi:branched-chain amino acid aminotransferase